MSSESKEQVQIPCVIAASQIALQRDNLRLTEVVAKMQEIQLRTNQQIDRSLDLIDQLVANQRRVMEFICREKRGEEEAEV